MYFSIDKNTRIQHEFLYTLLFSSFLSDEIFCFSLVYTMELGYFKSQETGRKIRIKKVVLNIVGPTNKFE